MSKQERDSKSIKEKSGERQPKEIRDDKVERSKMLCFAIKKLNVEKSMCL